MKKIIRQCNDNNPKKFSVTFDASKSIMNDVILLCEKCYDKPPFNLFRLKVERLKNHV